MLMATTATPERVHFNAYIDSDVRDELERLARENDRSLSAQARIALREHVERDDHEEEHR
jgi:predicted transcriptional regulator